MSDLIYLSPENPYSHHTAMARTQASYPVRYLHRHGYVVGRVLDFGSGHGADVRYLQQVGLDVTGYDPFFAPSVPTGKFDTILCTYVLNVLLPLEQAHVLMAVSELLRPEGYAYFTVRRDIGRSGFRRHAVHKTQVYQCRVRLPYPSLLRVAHCEIYRYQHLYFPHNADCDCPLCYPVDRAALLTESATVYAVRAHPTTAAALIVPKQHCTTFDELPPRTLTALEVVTGRVATILDPIQPPNAWRISHCDGDGCHAHLRMAALT